MDTIDNLESFRKELTTLINRYSLEGVEGGNVPDYILADVMVNALLSFNMNHKAVCKWYGVELEPGSTRLVSNAEKENRVTRGTE
jgi:hypothetical protein